MHTFTNLHSSPQNSVCT